MSSAILAATHRGAALRHADRMLALCDSVLVDQDPLAKVLACCDEMRALYGPPYPTDSLLMGMSW